MSKIPVPVVVVIVLVAIVAVFLAVRSTSGGNSGPVPTGPPKQAMQQFNQSGRQGVRGDNSSIGGGGR